MPDFGTIDHTSPPVKFAPIGCCIYCGSTEPPLTDEHIIPQGLGGREFLRDASCESCRVKTGKFEEVVQRGMVWALRRTLGMRGKRRPPSHIPAAGWRDGKPYAEVTMHDKIAVKGALPVFSRPPGLLVGQTYLDDAPLQTVVFYEASQIGHFGKAGATAHVDPMATIRMLAKIAHATAVGLCGLDGFDPFLVDLILGRSEAWNMLVGAAPIQKPPAENGVGHSIIVSRSTAEGFDGLLWGRIRLFAEIAIGHARDNGKSPRIS
jgi:HNH endonuclease